MYKVVTAFETFYLAFSETAFTLSTCIKINKSKPYFWIKYCMSLPLFAVGNLCPSEITK